MPELRLTPEEQKTLDQLAQMLRRDYGSVVADIRLFGSKARGDVTSDSDLDVLVLVREPLDWATKGAIGDRVTDLDIDNGTVTSLLFFSTDQWERRANRVTGLYRNVAREGVAL